LLYAILALFFVGVSSVLEFRHFSRSRATDTITLRIIVLDSAAEARHVVEQIGRGASFAEVAKAASIDATADKGGLVGTVKLSALHPELRSALKGMRVGQTTPVVQIPTGFAVLQVVPRSEATDDLATSTTVSPTMAAFGSWKQVFNLSGSIESSTALNLFSKPLDWEQDPRTMCDVRAQSAAWGKQTRAAVVA
jgi:hypothetical protein